MASSKVDAPPGTIDDAVANLLLWGSRAGSGLARVDYLSEHSARRCREQLRQELAAGDLPFHELRLPGGLTPARLARLWIDKLKAPSGGVVSVTGFADAFSAGPDLEEELMKLNYYRERLAEPPVRQIWWMPADFADHFLRAAPDLNSWFTKRLRLEERVEGKTCFISHSDADRAWAEWIARQLEDAGFASRLQAWQFRPGTDFVSRIEQSLADADYIIAVLSPSYLDSKFAMSEWHAALANDFTPNERRIISVRVKECDLQPPAHNAYVDLVNVGETDAIFKLKAAVGAGVAKSTAEPSLQGRSEPANGRSPRFPGSLPRVWNVPHPRNPNFVGREELLARLRSALLLRQPAALVQAITGLGGVGKTEAAVEYAYRHVDDFDVVWWIRAEQPATLAGDFAALASPLNLPEKDSLDQESVIDAVREWLERHERWLLVFDNVHTPEDLYKYLPRAATGQVLVTSRNANWKGPAAQLHVEVFRRDESVRFLLQRAGTTDRDSSASEIAMEREAAEWLGAELGDLPLALDLAAAYIRAKRIFLKDYLRLFQEAFQGIRSTVAGAIELNIEQARQQSEHCEAILTLCAFLAPDDIPIDVLLGGAADLSDVPELAPLQDECNRNRALAALCQYSLLERSEEMVSVHRLVQAAMYDRLPEAARRRWAELAVQLVNQHLATDVNSNVACWPTYARLLTHALAAVDRADKLKLAGDKLTRVLNQMGQYLQLRAQFAQAEPLKRRALAIDEQSYGAEHPNVAIRLNNLATLLQATNRLAEAEPLMRRGLAIEEQSRGPDHPFVANQLNNLAQLLQATNRLAEAEPLMARVVSIFEKSLGEDHPNVATALNNLAQLLQATNRLAEAEPLMRRALAIDEQSYGDEHPNVARDLNNLAQLLQATNRLAEAEPLMRRALAIAADFKRRTGHEHPSFGGRIETYRSILSEMGVPPNDINRRVRDACEE
ncbi:MAG: toll/interleukin-1 receptor domain-containing protein [Planctomycetaceae bacterium]|nr:toll/interleukin-1 receptor domain-containing protein [Planctomycetaceae bacterium]